jgi:hypothetical protein
VRRTKKGAKYEPEVILTGCLLQQCLWQRTDCA